MMPLFSRENGVLGKKPAIVQETLYLTPHLLATGKRCGFATFIAAAARNGKSLHLQAFEKSAAILSFQTQRFFYCLPISFFPGASLPACHINASENNEQPKQHIPLDCFVQ